VKINGKYQMIQRGLLQKAGACVLVGLLLVGNVWSLERIRYNHSGLVVDLGVGLWAWPMPMDWDGDGDLDLVVSCPDVPFNGIYLFENPGGGGNMLAASRGC
jgi:hypothetical protein